jgi:hypothetical protein
MSKNILFREIAIVEKAGVEILNSRSLNHGINHSR